MILFFLFFTNINSDYNVYIIVVNYFKDLCFCTCIKLGPIFVMGFVRFGSVRFTGNGQQLFYCILSFS